MRLKLAAAAVLVLGAGGCYVVATPRGLALGVAMTPVYSVIPGTGIRVVTNAPGDVFHYGGAYYRWFSGRWWRSPTWRAGWTPITVVPRAFLNIPATHRRYHVVRHHPAHPAHPAHPVRPVVRKKVRKEVREAVREKVKPVPAPKPPKVRRVPPARPSKEKKEKKEREEKEKKGNRGRGRK